jgi:hypothetical protein
MVEAGVGRRFEGETGDEEPRMAVTRQRNTYRKGH